MKIDKISQTQQNQINRISQLKNESIFSYFSGSYKEHVRAKKAYATEAIKDFQLTKQAKGASFQNISLFSKPGMRIALFMILDKLRIKSPAEKQFNKFAKAERALQKYSKHIKA